MSIDRTGALPTEALVHHVAGEVDIASAGRLRAALRLTIDVSSGPVVLDLGAMSFIDASGLSVLVWFATEMRARGRQASLQAANDSTLRVLRVTRVDTLFPPLAAAPELAGAGWTP